MPLHYLTKNNTCEWPALNTLTWPLCLLQRADQAIADFFVSIENAIFGLADVITGKKQAQVSIAPPSFFNNGAANISTSLAGISGQVCCLTVPFLAWCD